MCTSIPSRYIGAALHGMQHHGVQKSRQNCRTVVNRLFQVCMLVQETQPISSTTATSTLNHWTTSPAPKAANYSKSEIIHTSVLPFWDRLHLCPDILVHNPCRYPWWSHFFIIMFVGSIWQGTRRTWRARGENDGKRSFEEKGREDPTSLSSQQEKIKSRIWLILLQSSPPCWQGLIWMCSFSPLGLPICENSSKVSCLI